MAWARAGQVTGESNSIEEFDVDTSTGIETPTISSAQAYTGTYSVLCSGANRRPTGLTFAAAACVRASMWFRYNGGTGELFRLRSTTTLAEIVLSGGNVSLEVAGVAKETKTATQCGLDAFDTWQHLALTYYADGAAGYVTFYVNGTAVLSWDGAVVGSPTSVYGPAGRTGGTLTASAYYDDLCADTSSSAEADLCPDAVRFVPKIGLATTSNVTWTVEGAATAHAALASNDGDTSYLLSTTAGDLAVLTLTDAVIPAEHTASRVHTLDFAKRGDASSTLKTSLIDGSANTDESAEMAPGTSYTRQWATFETAPDGGAWDNTKVNDISLGVESAGSFA